MFQFNLKPTKLENLNAKLIEQEIVDGFEALAHFIQLSITGDYLEMAPFNERQSHISNVFSYLYDYVSKGELTPDHREDDLLDVLGFVANARINGELFSGAVPVNLENLLALAFARSKIDAVGGGVRFAFEAISDWFESSQSEFMSLAEIAALASMDEQSVRNATQADASDHLPSEKIDNRIYVSVDGAAGWLQRRSGYISSKPTTDEIPEDHILLPVAKDGSYFSNVCKQTAGFKVGKKGNEEYIRKFEQALDALRSMPIAYWRRPNENGRYGIVRAVEWKVVALSDI